MPATCAFAAGAASAAAGGGRRHARRGSIPGAAGASGHEFARVMGAAMGALRGFIAKGDFLKFPATFAAGKFKNRHNILNWSLKPWKYQQGFQINNNPQGGKADAL